MDDDYDQPHTPHVRQRASFYAVLVVAPTQPLARSTVYRRTVGGAGRRAAPTAPSGGKSKTITLPKLPGSDAAASVTNTVTAFSAGAVGNMTAFTRRCDQQDQSCCQNRLPAPSAHPAAAEAAAVVLPVYALAPVPALDVPAPVLAGADKIQCYRWFGNELMSKITSTLARNCMNIKRESGDLRTASICGLKQMAMVSC